MLESGLCLGEYSYAWGWAMFGEWGYARGVGSMLREGARRCTCFQLCCWGLVWLKTVPV